MWPSTDIGSGPTRSTCTCANFVAGSGICTTSVFFCAVALPRVQPEQSWHHQIHSLATQTCWPPSTCSPGCLDVLGHELLQKLCATGNSGRRTLLRCHTISPLLPLPPSALPVRGCSQCSAFPNFAATLLRWGQCQKYTSLRGASATAAAGLDSASRTTLSLLSTWCRSAVNSEM